MMLLDINDPKLVPLEFATNFVNSFGNISGSIPLPVSLRLTITSLLLLLSIVFSGVVILTDTIPDVVVAASPS